MKGRTGLEENEGPLFHAGSPMRVKSVDFGGKPSYQPSALIQFCLFQNVLPHAYRYVELVLTGILLVTTSTCSKSLFSRE